MNLVLYTEYYQGLEDQINNLLGEGHTLTIVSSESLKLPFSFWHPDRADLIKGAFFVIDKQYDPFIGFYHNLESMPFDMIFCCKNVKDKIRVKNHSEIANINLHFFDIGEELKIIDSFKKIDETIYFTLLTPVYNTNLKFLKKCFESVSKQIYKNFEWIVINDGSDEITTKILEKFNEKYKCCKLLHFDENKGIAKALTEGLRISRGDYICFLDSDDELEDNCFLEIFNYVRSNPDVKFIYTDERQVDESGSVISDTRKPFFNLELFYQVMFVNHMKIIHKDVIDEIGYPNPEYGGSWDYENFLRISEKVKVGHLGKLIYKWRRKDYEGGFMDEGKQMIHHQHALRAIRESNKRTNLIDGEIIPTEISWHYRIKRKVKYFAKVKVLILTKNKVNLLKLLLDSIEREVQYPNYEIVITQHVHDESKLMTEFLKTVPFKVNRCNIEWNYSKITNWQIEQSYNSKSDDYVLILNDDLVFQTDVIKETVACQQAFDKEGCGIVGCKLVWVDINEFKFYGMKFDSWPVWNGTIQHAGVDFYKDNACGHYCYGKPSSWIQANYVREVPAVTFACVLLKNKVIDKLKFDERLSVDYQDIDFCLRAKERFGFKIWYTPWAVSIHWESVTKDGGNIDDRIRFLERWREYLEQYPTQEQRHYDIEMGA